MNNARNFRLQQEADIEREKLKQRAKDDGTDMDRLVFESAKWSWRDDEPSELESNEQCVHLITK